MRYVALLRGIRLRDVHLGMGALSFLAFLGTGLYMHFPLDHLRGMAEFPRALYLSGHIYLLFSALLNVALGLYLVGSRIQWRRRLQRIGSISIIGAPSFFLYGFFVETPLGVIDRPITFWAIIGSALALLLHAIAALGDAHRSRREEQDDIATIA